MQQYAYEGQKTPVDVGRSSPSTLKGAFLIFYYYVGQVSSTALLRNRPVSDCQIPEVLELQTIPLISHLCGLRELTLSYYCLCGTYFNPVSHLHSS